MRKPVFLCAIFFLIAVASSAQTITITGTVKTQDGDALHLAFVQDKTYKTGAYTDSTGYFSLLVYPDSRLGVRCFGFRDTIIPINNRTSFAIVLKANVDIRASKGGIEESNADAINLATIRDQIMNDQAAGSFELAKENRPTPYPGVLVNRTVKVPTAQPIPANDDVNVVNKLNSNPSTIVKGYGAVGGSPTAQQSGVDMAQGAIYPVFQHKEATQGSRYLFNSWVHGYIVNSIDSIIQNPAFLFNYDKISGTLILSKDRHSAIELYNTSVRSFTLFDASNQPYTFALVPQIDKNHYVQVISSCSNYAIFKLIKTKFVAANYTTDGVASTGNDYDSYENEETYYILNSKTSQLQKLTLRKKALKEAFADQTEKLNKFMAENSGDIDDAYLANLCQYISSK